MKTNKVIKEDQAKQLRFHLSGQPRTLVPKTMDKIEDVWKILDSMNGDNYRLMKARKKIILELGPFPSRAGRLKQATTRPLVGAHQPRGYQFLLLKEH